MIRPSKNRITLGFNATTPPYSKASPHKGTDFAASPDKSIYKMFDGPIQLVPWNGKTTEGNMAIEVTGDLRFAHCHIEKFLVKDGQVVKKGTPIAIMGYTGYVVPPGENGRHLHTTARRNGILFDLETLTFEEDDMFEGKSTQEWAVIAKDNDRWKKTFQPLTFTKYYRAMGGTPGNPDADPKLINGVLEDFESIKQKYQSIDLNAQTKLDEVKGILNK